MTASRQTKSTIIECVVGRSKVSFEHIPAEQTVVLQHLQPLALTTKAQMDDYFSTIAQFWRSHCEGSKVYWVVNLDNFTLEVPKELAEHYGNSIRKGGEMSITSVRYGGSMLQRIVSRMAAIQRHEPSNVYASREEALSMVRGLRAGTVHLAQ